MIEAFRWAIVDRGVEPPADVYCRTRDIAVARLDTFRYLTEQSGASRDAAALVTAVAGELTNNCFDHNLGVWRDVPVTPDRLLHAIQPAEDTVLGVYAALTIPDIRRTLANL